MSSGTSRLSASAPTDPEGSRPRGDLSKPIDQVLAALRDLMNAALDAGVPAEEVAAIICRGAFTPESGRGPTGRR